MKLKERLGEWFNTPLRYEFGKYYMKKLHAYIRSERIKYTIFPSNYQVFRALRLTPLDDVKVVILGQNPYPHKAANGLAFSCDEKMESIPASLKNIFKEVEDDIGFQPYHNPDLERWAKQGVLLLNTSLTVRQNQPGSHSVYEWKIFISKIIELVCNKKDPVVFILWGRQAQYKSVLIPEHHYVIHAPRPSPYAAYTGFFGSKCFSRCNEYLKQENKPEIDWLKNEI